MPLDWTKHCVAISKRWGPKTPLPPATDGTEEEDSEQPVQDNNISSFENETGTGTRYFLHMTFAVHFFLQFLNALIQHVTETPLYVVYIALLHGPVLLFIVWTGQIFQQVTSKRFFGLATKEFNAILTPMGCMTMHDTKSVPQDVRVSMMAPLGYSLLALFWLAWYSILDAADFDDTLTNGVVIEELSNFWKFLANVCAQALWVCAYLVALHIAVPVFPLSGASFFAACLSEFGLGVRKTAMIMDISGAVLSLVLLVVGIQQTFWDDQNGIGVFVLFNSLVLVLVGVKKSLEGLDQHALVTRSCYSEKENADEGAEATASSSSQNDNRAGIARTTSNDNQEDFEELELV